MGTTKTHVESDTTQASASPAMEPLRPEPEQHMGPVHAQRKSTDAPPPPPTGASSDEGGNGNIQFPPDTSQIYRSQVTLGIQRSAGNAHMTRMLNGVQAKLSVSNPGDRYEQEADEAASRIVSGQKVARISRIAGHASVPLSRQVEKQEPPEQDQIPSGDDQSGDIQPSVLAQKEPQVLVPAPLEQGDEAMPLQAKAEMENTTDTYESEEKQSEGNNVKADALEVRASSPAQDEKRTEESSRPLSTPSIQMKAKEKEEDHAEGKNQLDEVPREELADEQASTLTQVQVRDIDTEPPETEPKNKTGASVAVPIQAKADAGGAVDDATAEARIKAPGGGRPLPQGLRMEMETGFGADLSHVRVHDASDDRGLAADLNAQAFTHGHHVWLGPGASVGNRKLLAHELTHVVQQGGGVQRKLPDEGPGEEASPRSASTQPFAQGGLLLPSVRAGAPESASSRQDVPEKRARPSGGQHQVSKPRLQKSPRLGEERESSGHVDQEKVREGHTPPSSVSPGCVDESHRRNSLDDEGAAQLASSLLVSTPQDAHTPAEAPLNVGMGDATGQAPAPFPLQRLNVVTSSITPVVQRNDSPGIGERIGGFFRGVGSAVVGAGSGLVRGVRNRINRVVSGLRSGWSSLSGGARAAFASMSAGFGGLLQGLRTAAGSVLSAVQGGWNALRQLAQRLTAGLTRRLSGAVGSIVGAARAVAAAIGRLDTEGAEAAWGRLTGALGGVYDSLRTAALGISEQLSGVWRRLGERFTRLSSRLANQARGLFTRLQGTASGLRRRLISAWSSVQQRASGLTSVIGGLAGRARSLLGGLISRGQSVWSGIQRGWRGLSQRVGGAFTGIRQRLSGLWRQLQQQARSAWNRIRGLWGDLQRWVRQQAQRLIDGVRTAWNSLRNLSITDLLMKISALSRVMHLARRIAGGLRELLTPIAAGITDKVYAAMPSSGLNWAEEQMVRAGGPSGLPIQVGGGGAATTQVQRQPRSTASWADIKAGVWAVLTDMWAQLTWSKFFEMVLNVLLEQLFPMVAIVRQLWGFFTEDIPNIAEGLFIPRNILTDPLGALHDIVTNIVHLFADFILAVLRRLMNVLMSFMFLITVVLTLIGLAGGAAAVGIFTGILGGLATLGIGAGSAAAGGAAAGGAAGAGVGFGVAMLVNEAIFFAFLIVHAVTFLQVLLDLILLRQTDEGKKTDYKQLAESGIAVGVGLALLALAWVAGLIARGVSALVKFLKIKPRSRFPRLSRFLRGAGSVRKPKPPKPGKDRPPTPAELAEALAAEQRLVPKVGDRLARELVAELGPRVAEEVVAQLGGNNVRRLGADISPQAIRAIARVLDEAAVTRLLNAGLRPGSIDAAVTAGQGLRLAALSTEQATRLAAFSENGFNRIIGLPEAQYQRFMALGRTQLRAFAEMEQAAFERFAALDEATFARFRALPAERIEAFAGLSDRAFNRYAALDAADFAKFERVGVDAVALERLGTLTPEQLTRLSTLTDSQLAVWAGVQESTLALVGGRDAATLARLAEGAGVAGLDRLAGMSPGFVGEFAQLEVAAMQRYIALPQNQLAKFETMVRADMQALAELPAGEMEHLAATMTEAQLQHSAHQRALGWDPAVGRFRPNEAVTGLRIEQARGIVLERYQPAPGQKGDWFDVATGEVYDGCSPPASQYFDHQIPLGGGGGGNYERSLIDHINHPTVDYVVIDTTGLGLTPAQEQALQVVINRVAGPNNPRIVRIP